MFDHRAKARNTRFSFEIFPPKTEKGAENLKKTLRGMAELAPEFISVTCGAGNAGVEDHFEICDYIQNTLNTQCVAHITCIGKTEKEIQKKLESYQKIGVESLLILRGDLPKNIKSPESDFQYASDLLQYCREKTPKFRTLVAGYPEGHCENLSAEKDFENQLRKAKLGAEILITQLFFINKIFLDYAEKLKTNGYSGRILPGIFVITDYKQILKISELCRPYFSRDILEACVNFRTQPEKMKNWGINFAVRQMEELQRFGIKQFHIYTMNNLELTDRVCSLFLEGSARNLYENHA